MKKLALLPLAALVFTAACSDNPTATTPGALFGNNTSSSNFTKLTEAPSFNAPVLLLDPTRVSLSITDFNNKVDGVHNVCTTTNGSGKTKTHISYDIERQAWDATAGAYVAAGEGGVGGSELDEPTAPFAATYIDSSPVAGAKYQYRVRGNNRCSTGEETMVYHTPWSDWSASITIPGGSNGTPTVSQCTAAVAVSNASVTPQTITVNVKGNQQVTLSGVLANFASPCNGAIEWSMVDSFSNQGQGQNANISFNWTASGITATATGFTAVASVPKTPVGRTYQFSIRVKNTSNAVWTNYGPYTVTTVSAN